MMWWNGGWGAMMFGPLLMVFVPVALVLILLWALRRSGPSSASSAHPQPPQAPLDILKERFARGEIDKEEYQEKRRILGV
jgi:putative membrane protein